MGTTTIKQLLDIAEDVEFKTLLQAQFDDYKRIHEEARDLLNKYGYDEKGIGAFEKMKTYLMINMQTMTDKSPSHIAEMMIIGSNMGVIEAIRILKKYDGVNQDIVCLMERLKAFEEDNIASLESFL
jgi:hypothetical protein